MLSESVQFDPAGSRSSYSDQPVPPGGIVRALRLAAESGGLDAVSELYNEALRYATEGHLRQARERLSVLLALAPEDGEARLLLAKFHVAGQRWREALAALDEAHSCGEQVPMALRQAVEEHLRADEASEEEHRAARTAREQGEIKALRQEARRLRSENAQLVGRNRDLEKETRKWAWTTAAVTAVAILFVVGNLFYALISGLSAPAVADAGPDAGPTAVEPVAAPHPPVATPPTAPAATPVAPAPVKPLGQRAADALRTQPGLEGSQIELTIDGEKAILGGSVPRYRQVKDAEHALLGVDGIHAVDSSRVTLLARTRGAQHTVVKGDNLSNIAYEYYGDSSKAKAILKANHALLHGRPDLQIGQHLTLPAIQ